VSDGAEVRCAEERGRVTPEHKFLKNIPLPYDPIQGQGQGHR